MPLPFLPLLKLGPLLLKYWRQILVALLVAAAGYYVYTAEKAKADLATLLDLAAQRDSIAHVYEDSSAALGVVIDSLRDDVEHADDEWEATVRRLRRQLAAKPTKPGLTDSAYTPAVPVDSTGQEVLPADTLSLCPGIETLIAACNKRVAARDSLIKVLDLRHETDSSTIAALRSVPPVIIDKGPSRLERIAVGAATAAVGAYAGQRMGGQKGLIIGTSLGALIGLLR